MQRKFKTYEEAKIFYDRVIEQGGSAALWDITLIPELVFLDGDQIQPTERETGLFEVKYELETMDDDKHD